MDLFGCKLAVLRNVCHLPLINEWYPESLDGDVVVLMRSCSNNRDRVVPWDLPSEGEERVRGNHMSRHRQQIPTLEDYARQD